MLTTIKFFKILFLFFLSSNLLSLAYASNFYNNEPTKQYNNNQNKEIDNKRLIENSISKCNDGDPKACYFLGTLDKEISAKLRIDYLLKSSLLGYIKADLYLGNIYSKGIDSKFAKNDILKAQHFFKKACNQKNTEGCFNYWVLSNKKSADTEKYLNEVCTSEQDKICLNYAKTLLNDRKEKTLPIKILEHMCSYDDQEACVALSDEYLSTNNLDKAFLLNNNACNKKIAQACINSAVVTRIILTKNKINNSKKINEELIPFAKKACTIDSDYCWFLGSLYLKSGIQTEEGLKLIRESCKKGLLDGCDALAHAYEYGLGLNRDLKKTQELLEQNCRHNPRYCKNLGIFIQKNNGDINIARECFIKSCEIGDYLTCSLAGLYYWYPEQNILVDKNKGIYFFEKACLHSIGDACTYLGHIYLRDKDNIKAKVYYEKGCEYNNSTSCHNMSVLNIADKEFHLAKIYAEKSCKLGNPIGCAQIGYPYFDENSPFRDLSKAEKYFRIGMENNDTASYFRFYFLALEKGEKYFQETRSKLEQACLKDNLYATCNLLGNSYQYGDLGIVDNEKFVYFSDIACKNNIEVSCSTLSLFYSTPPNHNISKANYYANLSCKQKNLDSCITYADTLVKLSKISEGLLLLDEYCTKNNSEACCLLGKYLLNLPTPYGNTERGLSLLENVLNYNSDESTEAALVLILYHLSTANDQISSNKATKLKKLSNYLKRSQIDELKAYANLINIVLSDNIERNIKELKEACNKDSKGACKILGNVYFNKTSSIKQNQKFGIKLLEKGCSLNDPCLELGYAYMSGKTLSKNPKKAFEIFETHCSMTNDMKSCMTASTLAYKGYGCEPTIEKAIMFMQKSGFNHEKLMKQENITFEEMLDYSFKQLMDNISNLTY